MILSFVHWQGGWVGESHVMRVAHLLGLQIYAGSFETDW
jgi:hypothetical protein